ncbi:MAG: Xaa-Pro peptidase family protein [Synergistaceae bacterium]|nr:Xaa-Pro peptidase family protein [Synergistaceae bacterium]
MVKNEEITLRQENVRRAMSKHGVDVLITGSSAQMEFRGVLRYLINYYLPVFEEFLVIPLSGPITFFAHDGCGAEYAGSLGSIGDARIIPGNEYNNDPGKCVAELVKSLGCKTVGIAGMAGFSANFYLSLQRHLGNGQLVDFTSQLNQIRMIKSPEEILLAEAAVKLNEETFYNYLSYVKPGNSELDAVNNASLFALNAGAEDLYWMVSSGKLPHLAFLHRARQRKHVWAKGDYNYIILEHSAAGGHFGETTQLISIGEPKPEYVRAFSAVSEAQKAAAAEIKPGAPVGDMADASDRVLAEWGYPQNQNEYSAIGHSQGFDVWEFPRIVHGEPTLIQPGMRFNIHPAVALPDGAKITSCDCHISTDTGARRLSSIPYEIIVL